MLPRWVRTCWKWPRSGRPATSRTPENVEHMWAAISKDRWWTVRELEAHLGIPNPLCPRLWHRILAETCGGKIHSAASATRRRNIVLQLSITLGELCEVPKCLLWRGLRCHCPMYNVSRILFNKCLFFIVYGWKLSGQTSYYVYMYIWTCKNVCI